MRSPFATILGPMKGVFRTPDNGPFFPSDTDIQPKINVARHRHSELVTRHLTLHFSPTLTVSFPSRHRTLRKISGRCRTLRSPGMGPDIEGRCCDISTSWAKWNVHVALIFPRVII